jgi:hypothetical protein
VKRTIAAIAAALAITGILTAPAASADQLCRDGWVSPTAPGTPGACSWHGGVYETPYVAPTPPPVEPERVYLYTLPDLPYGWKCAEASQTHTRTWYDPNAAAMCGVTYEYRGKDQRKAAACVKDAQQAIAESGLTVTVGEVQAHRLPYPARLWVMVDMRVAYVVTEVTP